MSILDATWRKSSRSGSEGACVEVRRVPSSVQVRDTKDRTGPVLSFPTDAWQGFIAAVHDGEFERP